MHPRTAPTAAGALACSLLALSCHSGGGEPSLRKQTPTFAAQDSNVDPSGPRLGSVANVTPIVERPGKDARIIGYLHGGGTVARAPEPVSKEDCAGGWYPVHPRGFVCVGEGASLDLQHPTLRAMAMQPKLDADLPYTYARTRRDTLTLEASTQGESGVRALTELPSHSGMAVIGSWNASDEKGHALRLAMMTDGRFVDAEELEQNRASTFRGLALDQKHALPVAFVVKRGVNSWTLGKRDASKQQQLGYHSVLELEGSSRKHNGERFWKLGSGEWVRHRDVTVIQARSEFPSFVQSEGRWIDVSVLTGTAVLYQGKQPVYATLVSVGQDRMGDPQTADTTLRGEFPIVFKHITTVAADPKRFASRVEMHDVPWALELSSGQWLHGAYWHDRFGIEHGPGNIQLAPADAAFVWHWAGPAVPEGWHGAAADPAQATIVNVRK